MGKTMGGHGVVLSFGQCAMRGQFLQSCKTMQILLIGMLYADPCPFDKNINRLVQMRPPGIEPGTQAWKACMLTITPRTPLSKRFWSKNVENALLSEFQFRYLDRKVSLPSGRAVKGYMP